MADPRDVDDVIDRLSAVSAGLPAGDGVRAFNEMYLETTRQVASALAGRAFADPEFLTRLDAVFADLYLHAWSGYLGDPAKVPASWRVLFDSAGTRGIGQLQFAVAGMNAHINYDLATALVSTAQELGVELDAQRERDFEQVNTVLADTAPKVREVLLTGAFATVDEALGTTDDRVSMWAIERAREYAWATAQAMWHVRGTPAASLLNGARDRLVAMSSRMLLAPIATT